MHYDFKDKRKNVAHLNNQMLAKTLPMFEWENLPDSIPNRELELLLQTHGYAFITEHNGELYALHGGLGGVSDAYGRPTEIVISNPYLKLNETFNLKDDGVLIYNDEMGIGLLPLLFRFNTFIVENDINLMLYGYNTRLTRLISADDDKTKDSAQHAVQKAVDGEIAVIGENAIFDGLKTHTTTGNDGQRLTSLLEYQQYLKASLNNELGMSSNFNMKRERLVNAEVKQGEDSLLPFVYSMAKCRIEATRRINEMFGQDIHVDFGSVWYFKHKEFVDNIVERKGDVVLSVEDETSVEQNQDGTLPAESFEVAEENEADATNNELEPEVENIEEPEVEPEKPEEPETDSEEITDDEKQKEINDLLSILEDPNLSEDEKVEFQTMLAKLKGENHDE